MSSAAIEDRLPVKQRVVFAELGGRHVDHRRWRGAPAMEKPCPQFIGADSDATLQQSPESLVHGTLCHLGGQLENQQVLFARTGRGMSPFELVVADAEAAAGKQVAPIAVVLEGARIVYQPIDDVAVLYVVSALSTQAPDALDAALRVPQSPNARRADPPPTAPRSLDCGPSRYSHLG